MEARGHEMIDFGAVLDAASRGWSTEEVCGVTSKLVLDTDLLVDWDQEAGEEWVSIIAGKMRVGMVSTSKPIVIVSDSMAVNLEQLINSDVEVVIVSSFDDPTILCDTEKLLGMFGEGVRSMPHGAPFSANDLWFATV